MVGSLARLPVATRYASTADQMATPSHASPAVNAPNKRARTSMTPPFFMSPLMNWPTPGMKSDTIVARAGFFPWRHGTRGR